MTFARRTLTLLCLSAQFTLAVAAAPGNHKGVYDYSLVGLDGKEVSLSMYKGKTLLIVNLASQSLYRNQISALQDLQATYAEKGLVIIGIPSDDFGKQELADNDALRRFYTESMHLTFPVFARVHLRGNNAIPLASFLTESKEGTGGGEIHWNFTKFLIDNQGHPVARFEAHSDPTDPEFRITIEQVLDGKYKKSEPTDKDPPAGSSDTDEDAG